MKTFNEERNQPQIEPDKYYIIYTSKLFASSIAVKILMSKTLVLKCIFTLMLFFIFYHFKWQEVTWECIFFLKYIVILSWKVNIRFLCWYKTGKKIFEYSYKRSLVSTSSS